MRLQIDVTTYKNFINGQWMESGSGEVQASLNPADYREVVGYVQMSAEEDAANAVVAAKEAAKGWRKTSGPARGEFLRKAADLLEQRMDDIAETITREMGKTLVEARGETARGAAILRYYAGEGMRSVGEVIPSNDESALLFTSRVPLGVVGLITPWNFPVAIPLWKMAPALIYGNTIVLKPALETSVTALKLIQCFIDAGIPAGVINVVTGAGSVVGRALSEHPDVKAISFTGSMEAGKIIATKALVRGAKYQLEMGGKNPVIVTEHADLEAAAEMTVAGSMKSAGQKCTATSRAIVVKEVYEAFRDKVVEKMKMIKVGNGLQPETYMGPLASKNQLRNILDAIQKGIAEGANLRLGGKRPNTLELAYGYYVEPTLFEDVQPWMHIAQEELFGPVLALIKVDSLEQALEVANDVRYGLSASIFTSRIDEMLTYINEMDAGVIRINGESSGVELQAPFGGMKDSGSHSREQGRAAMEFFTDVKTVTIKP